MYEINVDKLVQSLFCLKTDGVKEEQKKKREVFEMKKIILHEINKDLIEPLSENFYSFEFVYFQLSVKENTHYCEHMILTSGITKLLKSCL